MEAVIRYYILPLVTTKSITIDEVIKIKNQYYRRTLNIPNQVPNEAISAMHSDESIMKILEAAIRKQNIIWPSTIPPNDIEETRQCVQANTFDIRGPN